MKKIDSTVKTTPQQPLDAHTPTNSYLFQGIIEKGLWGIGSITSLAGVAKIDSVDKTTSQQPLDPYTPTDSYFSQGMIEKGLWGIGSITSLSGAANFEWGFPFLPLALTALTAVCIYNACLTRNYDSSAEVEQYQKDCEKNSLQDAFKKHGKQVFARQLLSPKQVEEKYLEEESALESIPSILAFYTQTESLRKLGDPDNRYTIPSPVRLKEKFQKICSFLSFEEIEKKHSLEKIFSWKLLSKEDFFSKYRDYQYKLFLSHGIGPVIDHYKKVQETQQQRLNSIQYEIPHPKNLKTAWYQSLQGISLKELAHNCSLEQLIAYEVLSEAEEIQKLQLLINKLDSVKSSYCTQMKLIEEVYKKTLKDADSLLSREKQTIQIAKEAIAEKKLEVNRQVEYLKERIRWAIERNDPVLVQKLKEDLSQLITSKACTTIINTLFTESDLEDHLEKAIRQNAESRTRAEQHRKSSQENLEKEYATTLLKLEDDFSDFKKYSLQD